MEYATLDDLAAYLAVEKAALAPNSQRLLDRASELIDRATKNRIDATQADQLEVAKNATLAQVEYWNVVGEEVSIVGPVGQVAISGFSMNGNLPDLAPRAKDILRASGLQSAAAYMGGSYNGRNAALAAKFFDTVKGGR